MKKKKPAAPESLTLKEEAPAYAATVPAQEIGAFEAKTHLSSILEKVAQGQTFIITKRGHPIAEIKPVDPPKNKRILGLWKDRIWISPDFDEPLEDFKEYM